MAIIVYTDEYIDNAFYLWYDNGRTVGSKLLSILPEVDGRKPGILTVKDWVVSKGWIERADALDAEVSREKDRIMIDKRKKMYEEQVVIADELLAKGREFLKDGGIRTGAEALRAIDLGLATKRISVGASEAYEKISQMSDEDIAKELRKLIGKRPVDEDSINVIPEEIP